MPNNPKLKEFIEIAAAFVVKKKIKAIASDIHKMLEEYAHSFDEEELIVSLHDLYEKLENNEY